MIANAPLKDLAQRLHDEGVAVLGDTLFFGRKPPKTGEVLAVLPLPWAPKPDRTMGRLSVLKDVIQVYYKSTKDVSVESTEATVVAIVNALDGFAGTINDTRYLFIQLQRTPDYLGHDENQCHCWSINFYVQRAA